jgi:hypothetical protein
MMLLRVRTMAQWKIRVQFATTQGQLKVRYLSLTRWQRANRKSIERERGGNEVV